VFSFLSANKLEFNDQFMKKSLEPVSINDKIFNAIFLAVEPTSGVAHPRPAAFGILVSRVPAAPAR
jgi:hypothetical protein